jgi:shikimate dehydrogenase
MITAHTQLVGIIGWPVGHSRSPAMHNAAFMALGMDWAYVPLPVAPPHLAAALRGLAALGFAGANVTVPHKVAALPLLDEVTSAAQEIGAVNTILVRDGHLVGDNTDHQGFLAALAEMGVSPQGWRVLVIGAGGAARAVAYALRGQAAHLIVGARRLEAAQEVAVLAGGEALPWPPSAPPAVDLIVQATPVGQWPEVDASPWPATLPIPQGAAVMDLITTPAITTFMARAQAAGCRVQGGLPMLIHQGAASFRLWTGREPPIDVMRQAVTRQAL